MHKSSFYNNGDIRSTWPNTLSIEHDKYSITRKCLRFIWSWLDHQLFYIRWFVWAVYPYSSGLFHWRWQAIVSLSGSEVNLKNMSKMSSTPQNTAKRKKQEGSDGRQWQLTPRNSRLYPCLIHYEKHIFEIAQWHKTEAEHFLQFHRTASMCTLWHFG